MTDKAIGSFKDLEVWQVSMDLVDVVLSSTTQLPGKDFDLRRQIRRASVSIPSNVAEGYKRKKKRGAYQNHVSIAMGSQGELETQVIICQRNQLMDNDSCNKLLALTDRVGAMLYRLHESLN